MLPDELLLIEDDTTTREVLTLLLEADGWVVHGSGSGESALELLRTRNAAPAVILCDLHLPGVHGDALAQQLRSKAPRAVLVAMSASAASLAAAEYDARLQKPFEPADLRKLLLTSGRAEAETPAPDADAPEAHTEGSHDDLPGEDLPVLAMETFLKLEQQMGLRAKELYAFALADAGDRIRRMEQKETLGDAAGYRAEAHALKGSAGMIGAERLAALAAVAEEGTAGASHNENVRRMHLACDEIRLMLETLFPL